MPGNPSHPELPALNPNGITAATSALPTSEFLRYLRSHDIEVRAEDGKLLLNVPAGTMTSELREELRRRKPELLHHLSSSLETSVEERSAPLTFAQQRLWLIDRMFPEAPTYNIPQSWIIEATVDCEALQGAIARLAERHQALRTSIEPRNGEPLQIVSRRVEIPLQVTDLSADADTESTRLKLNAALVQEGRRPFSLHQAPLIRFHLFRLATDRHLLFYNIHHILADQWSLNTLQRDLAALYVEAASGQPADLPSLSLAYSDVAEQERSEASIHLHASQLDYWRERLRGMPVLLELPFSKSRPSQQTSEGATLSLTLDQNLTRQLRQLASSHGTSLYLLMLTVFAALLYRYTGQRDLCLGSPITGRKRREEEDVVGLFLNMLPLRCMMDPNEPFNLLLKRTSRAVLADFERSDLPFQKLVMELHPERSPSYSPLFQMLFALNPKGSKNGQEQQETFIGIAKFDLTLQMAEQQDTLDGYFEYRTDLFTHEDMTAFSRHFVQLVESVVKEPETAVGSLPLLTSEDLSVLAQWNSTAIPFDRTETLTSLFERQVSICPDAIALCCAETLLSFRELHERVSRLAISLRARGVKTGDFIAVCLERSPDLIVSILAILQAGAAYLPLDPKYPEERLRFMLQDSGARLIIAERNDLTAKLVQEGAGIDILFAADELSLRDQRGNEVPPLKPATPDDAAYLIYTSGSTGKPKGVVVEQKNAVALLAWAQSFFDPEPLLGMLASTSVCFDLSIFEIFLPLITGHTVVLVNDVLELPTSRHKEKVTLVNTVPSAMSSLLQAGLPPTVRTVCMAGEFLPTELVDRVYAAGVEQVFDLYGPTETTTYSTCALRRAGAAATIGEPIGNTRIYLLDETNSLVPPGAIGEIFIGGEGVTRGYLERAELTEERFVMLPAIDGCGRLYRTGDLARQRRDGSLIYLGRRDQQIKLRGHRIELGEIESALRDSSTASDVAVVVQKRDAGDLLVAFLAASDVSSIDPAECTAALRKRLPAHMVPALIIPLPALPLTPNGKIDKKSLSLMMEISPRYEMKAARDLLEQWLANIWAFRLKQKQIARNANFFDDLGGHSLAAFEIFTEIELRTGVAMGLATLFQAPTVELLARAVRRKGWTGLRHIAFVAPGLAEKVIYLIGELSVSEIEALKSCGTRIMAIESMNTSTDVEDCVREIASFEAHRPRIVFASRDIAGEKIHGLVSGSTQAGFVDISLSTMDSLSADLADTPGSRE